VKDTESTPGWKDLGSIAWQMLLTLKQTTCQCCDSPLVAPPYFLDDHRSSDPGVARLSLMGDRGCQGSAL
jgi:hypothetical protein